MPDEPVKQDPPASEDPKYDVEALEIGELLKAAGYGKDNVNDLTNSVESLRSMNHILNNDPKEFLKMYERNNADGAKKFHEALAQEYIDRYAPKDSDKGGKEGKDSELAIEVKMLTEKVNKTQADQAARDQAAIMSQIKQRYDARVDDVIAQLPKEMNLTKSEREAFRAQLNNRLASDPAIVDRCQKGNFFDVPKVFADQLKEWTADRTAAATAEKEARDKSKEKGLAELLSAPYLTLPTNFDIEKLAAGDDWEPNIEALGKAMENS